RTGDPCEIHGNNELLRHNTNKNPNHKRPHITQHMSCENCVTGHLHAGTPTGQVTTVGELPCYVAKPRDGNKKKSLLFITDIFGWEISVSERASNARLLADEYAKEGFYVYVPDFFENDSFPIEHLKVIAPLPSDPKAEGLIETVIDKGPTMAQFGVWSVKHRESVVRPLMDKVIDSIWSDPQTSSLFVIGFCWGGYHSTVLAQEGTKVDAAIACHPAGVDGKILEKLTKPYSLQVGALDSFFDDKAANDAREVLSKMKITYQVNIYPGQVHGFAVRGDLSQRDVKEGKEKCFRSCVQFLNSL
ncbi:hypothetical protein PROFUN_13802, partial [Planoprotostelium fungivorum]